MASRKIERETQKDLTNYYMNRPFFIALNARRKKMRERFIKKFGYDDGHRRDDECYGCRKTLDKQYQIKFPTRAFCWTCTEIHERVGTT